MQKKTVKMYVVYHEGYNRSNKNNTIINKSFQQKKTCLISVTQKQKEIRSLHRSVEVSE